MPDAALSNVVLHLSFSFLPMEESLPQEVLSTWRECWGPDSPEGGLETSCQ